MRDIVELLRLPIRLDGTNSDDSWEEYDELHLAAASEIERLRAALAEWRRAFTAYVGPEEPVRQLAIALCAADGNNPDATVSVDGGPLQRHWHYYSDRARDMLKEQSHE